MSFSENYELFKESAKVAPKHAVLAIAILITFAVSFISGIVYWIYHKKEEKNEKVEKDSKWVSIGFGIAFIIFVIALIVITIRDSN